MRTILGLCLTAGAALLLLGCGASGAGGREVNITQTDEGCTPTSVEATPGEKLNLKVKNETGDIYEIEGIDGAKLEEVIVPEGRTRSIGYNVPDSGGTTKLKCYVPGGTSTIIEVNAGEGPTGDVGAGEPTEEGEALVADSRVVVLLDEYTVEPGRASLEAGNIEFEAINEGKEIHELYVLKVREGGYDVVGEIENIAPGDSGKMTLALEAGEYQLACLIVPGEADSTVDHFKKGMHTDFVVE
ncbi:MAG TPA: hypothetical protein VFP63_07690 [Dehalococcoidia bacterium]|nr:hypothetical protein [Dehalococcoidia bacterium]